MRRRTAIVLALTPLAALAVVALAATSGAGAEERTVSLGPGCNVVTLTFASGTEAAALAGAVSPSTALQSVWRPDNASHSFQAFVPDAPQASDLTSLNLLDAVFICVNATASISMPSISTDPAGSPISTNLSVGCSALGLTFSDGTAPSAAAGAIAPPEAFESLWRLDNATGAFQAYVAAAPQASDLASLQFLDAVFVCTSGPATLEMPGVTAPGAVAPAGPSSDLKPVMEGAVPQGVDLPEGFTAVDETFKSFEPADAPGGMLYYYGIAYEDPIAFLAGPLESPFFARFELAVFDKEADAESLMQEMSAATAEQIQASLESSVARPLGLEVDSVTIESVEPLATIGEEASFIRVRMYARPVGSTTVFLPMVIDVFTIRRDRVVGQVFLAWTPGPPGPKFVPENLAKKMDAGIQQALPALLAARP